MAETYPTAFSTELKRDMDSEEAYQASINRELNDKKAFQCSEDCPTFKLTLTNFGKKEYIYSPYFRPGSLNQVHSPSCSIIKRNYDNRIGTKESSYIFSRTDSNVIVDLNLIKGVLLPPEDSKEKNTSGINGGIATKKTTENNEETESKLAYKHIKSLARLVKIYFDSKEGELYRFFDMNRNEITLSDYFEELYVDKEIEEHVNKIYYGEVSIFKKNPTNDPYFHIRFTSPCKVNGKQVTPTVNINLRLADHRGVKSKIKQLEKLSESKEKFTLFYFGSFIDNDPYLNFDKPHNEIIDYLFFRD